MTLPTIVAALEALALQLANKQPVDVPPASTGLTEMEWAYVSGLATGAILTLRDRLN